MDMGPWRIEEHANDWCFRDIYKGGLWEDDLYIYAFIWIGDFYGGQHAC